MLEEDIRELANELCLDEWDEWEFLSERGLLCDYNVANPNTRVACLPKETRDDPDRRHSYTLPEALQYFAEKYPTGRVGMFFETGRYYCLRVRKDDV